MWLADCRPAGPRSSPAPLSWLSFFAHRLCLKDLSLASSVLRRLSEVAAPAGRACTYTLSYEKLAFGRNESLVVAVRSLTEVPQLRTHFPDHPLLQNHLRA